MKEFVLNFYSYECSGNLSIADNEDDDEDDDDYQAIMIESEETNSQETSSIRNSRNRKSRNRNRKSVEQH